MAEIGDTVKELVPLVNSGIEGIKSIPSDLGTGRNVQIPVKAIKRVGGVAVKPLEVVSDMVQRGISKLNLRR